jgi:serine/threonine protein kinase
MYDIPRGKVHPSPSSPAPHTQSFARKLVRIPRVDSKVVENEVQALKELCREGAHPNVVALLQIGELRNSQDLFIDMELCDLNLLEYIHGTDPHASTFFVKDQPPPMKARQVWNVMLQITRGVEYVHHKRLVHRDLKPANGGFKSVALC